MPIFTNKHGAPDILFRLLGRDKYTKGDAKISVTELMSAPRQRLLKARHEDAIEVDISERLWSLFGSAVHDMIDRGTDAEDHITEERIHTEIEGWKISGGIDVQRIGPEGTARILDWKVTSCMKVMMSTYEDWENQLNAYAYLVEKEKGLTIEGIEICAILRDWKKSEAQRNPKYPQSPIHTIEINLWPFEKREAYLTGRVRAHKEANMLQQLDDPLPECTPSEMWEKPATFAIMKKGGKRALKLCETREQAEQELASYNIAVMGEPPKYNDYVIDERPGKRIKCEEYCEVSRWCSQHQEHLKKKKGDD